MKFARSNNDFKQWNTSRSWAAIVLHYQCFYLFRWTKEFTQLPNMKQKNLNPRWRILETVCLSIRSPSIQSNSCQRYDEINEFWTVLKQCNYLDNGSRVSIWEYCLIVLNPQANPSSVSNQQKLRRWIGHTSWQSIFWTVLSIQILTTDNPSVLLC